ncbi:hypothetical protein [Novosphingobium guangzhouense]|nr:hypothetical protein [Novosphingobium guangzhouense]
MPTTQIMQQFFWQEELTCAASKYSLALSAIAIEAPPAATLGITTAYI